MNANVKHFLHRFQAKVAKKWDVKLFGGIFFPAAGK